MNGNNSTVDFIINGGVVFSNVQQQATNAVRQANAIFERTKFNLRVDDRSFSQPLGRMTSNLNQFNKSLDAATSRVLAFSATASIIIGVERALSGTVKSMIEVEKAITSISVIMNSTGRSLDKFKNDLFSIAKETGQSFKITSDAALELARQGLSMEETLKRTKAALILTRQSGLDAASSVEALTAAMNSFSESAIDVNQLVSKMASLDQAFAVSSADLAEAIKRVGSSAQDAGVDIDKLMALVTAAQQTTARGGAVIGNAIKTIFTRIQRGSVLDQLEELGIQVKDLGRNILPADQILTNLAITYDKLGQSQRAQVAELVGGVYQINILKGTLGTLTKEWGLYNSALKISQGATDEAIIRNQKLNETLAATLNRLFTNLTQAGSKVGDTAFAPLKNLVNIVNTSLEGSINSKESEGMGVKIGEGILQGLASFISGPAFITVAFTLGKVFLRFASDTGKAISSILGTNDALRIQESIYSNILNQLTSEQLSLEKIKSGEISLVELSNQRLAAETRLLEIRKMAAGMAAYQTQQLTGAGFSYGKLPYESSAEGIKKKDKVIPFFANFNTLGGALAQEAMVRPSSTIRVGHDPRLSTSFNPLGLGVYNTLDEPRGLAMGVNRAFHEGYNPRGVGIPNFAQPLQYSNFSVYADADFIKTSEMAADQLRMAARRGTLKLDEISKAAEDFKNAFQISSDYIKKSFIPSLRENVRLYTIEQKSIKNSQITGDLIGANRGMLDLLQGGTSIPGEHTKIGNIKDYLAKKNFYEQISAATAIESERLKKQLENRINSARGLAENYLSKTGNIFSGGSYSKKAQLEIDKLNTLGATGIANDLAAQLALNRQQRQGKVQNTALIGSFIAPMAINAVGNSLGGDRKTQAIAAGLGDFASLGLFGASMGGPAAIITASVGAFMGLNRVFKEYSTNLPEVSKAADEFANSLTKVQTQFQEISVLSEKISNMVSGRVNYTERELNSARIRQYSAIAGIPDADIRFQTRKAIEENDMAKVNRIYAEYTAQNAPISSAMQANKNIYGIYENFKSISNGNYIDELAKKSPFSGIQGIAGLQALYNQYVAGDKFGLNQENALSPDVKNSIRGSLAGILQTRSKIPNKTIEQWLIENQDVLNSLQTDVEGGRGDLFINKLSKISGMKDRDQWGDLVNPLGQFINAKNTKTGTKQNLAGNLMSSVISNFLGGFRGMDESIKKAEKTQIDFVAERMKDDLNTFLDSINNSIGQNWLSYFFAQGDNDKKTKNAIDKIKRDLGIKLAGIYGYEGDEELAKLESDFIDRLNEIQNTKNTALHALFLESNDRNTKTLENLKTKTSELINSNRLDEPKKELVIGGKNAILGTSQKNLEGIQTSLKRGDYDEILSSILNARAKSDTQLSILVERFKIDKGENRSTEGTEIQIKALEEQLLYYTELQRKVLELKGEEEARTKALKEQNEQLTKNQNTTTSDIILRKFKGIGAENSSSILDAIVGLRTSGGSLNNLEKVADLTKGLGRALPEDIREKLIQGRAVQLEKTGLSQSDAYAAAKNQITEIYSKEKVILDLRKMESEVLKEISKEIENQYFKTRELQKITSQLNYTFAKKQFDAGNMSAEEFRGFLDSKNTADIADKTYNLRNAKDTFIGQWAYKTQDALKDLDTAAKEISLSMKDGFKDAFKSFIDGSKNAKESLRDFGLNIFNTILNNSLNMGVNSLFGAIGGSLGGGSSILSGLFSTKKYASGGMVTGGSGYKDDVLSSLTRGEYVVNKRAVNKYGPGFLTALNSGLIPRYAIGGSARVGLSNKFFYNDKYKPSYGWSSTDSALSNFALSDEDSVLNQTRMSRESEYYSYLNDYSAYLEDKRKSLANFRRGQNQRLIGAWMSAAMNIVGGAVAAKAQSGGSGSPNSSEGATKGMVGEYPGKAMGGYVDRSPALLMGGEFIANRQAVNKYGVGFFNRLNSGQIPRYATGGLVGADSGTPLYSSGSGSSFSDSLSQLVEINTSIRDALTGNTGNNQINNTTQSPISNTINITINSNGNGSPTADTNNSNNSNSTNNQDIENNKKLAKSIEQVVLQTIVKQQRNGGLLEKGRPS